MHVLVQALYWLSLSTWFGAALFSAVAPPIILRVIQAADPTLPRVLSVNLDRQHSTLLASQVAGEILLAMFRVEGIAAATFLPALVAQWFLVDRTGPNIVLPIVVTALYIGAALFLVFGWRVIWPRVMQHRAAFIEHADDPDLANGELDQFDRYSGELFATVRNLLFAVLGIVLFSASLLPHVQTLTAQ